MNEFSNAFNVQPIVTPPANANLYIIEVLNSDSIARLDGSIQLLMNNAQPIQTPYQLPVTNESQVAQQEYQTTVQTEPVTCISGQELLEISRPKLAPSVTNTSTSSQKCQKPDTVKRVTKKTNTQTGSRNSKKLQDYKKNYLAHIPDRVVPPRAVLVLPEVLLMRGEAIWPRKPLPPHVRFGPVIGVKSLIFPAEADELALEAAIAKTPIFFSWRDSESVLLADVSNKDRSNWLSLLPLGDQDTANLWLYEEDKEIYAVTTKVIHPRTPMLLGYSKRYAERHKLPPGQPLLDLEEAFAVEPKEFWCFECRRVMTSAALLERHNKVYHKNMFTRRLHKCQKCSRTFSRLSTLKKHLRESCTKPDAKTETSKEAETIEHEPDPPAQNTEEHRIPSDESFQNYTNGLDFSTSLFDTDRISNLDISGSSRSDIEFNLYSHLDDLGKVTPNSESTKTKIKNDEPIFDTCVHCDQTILKTKKRKHVSECPARNFKCGCNQVFRNKNKLAEHLCLIHPEKLRSKDESKQEIKEVTTKETTAVSESKYKCDECKLNFKRRGMLVNHLFKIHNSASVSIPFEKRVLYYPCTVCNKIYRTAAKRDHHFKVHHPGAKFVRASIEGGKRTCEPAKCPICPRQYATRSKLLQHQRAQHSDLAEQLDIKLPKKLSRAKKKTQR